MDGYESLWQAIDRRIGLKTRELARPYTAYVEAVDTVNNKARVRLPGETLATGDLPWAPVYGAMPVVTDWVFTLVDFPGRRVITSGGGSSGPTQAIGAFSAYRNTTQSDIPDSTWTKVEYTGEDYDVSGWYNAANSRYTPLTAGYYRFSAHFTINPAVDGSRVFMALYKNGVEHQRFGQVHAASTQAVGVMGSVQAQANGSTDYFEVWMEHLFGVGTSDMASSNLLKFHGEFIGTD